MKENEYIEVISGVARVKGGPMVEWLKESYRSRMQLFRDNHDHEVSDIAKCYNITPEAVEAALAYDEAK